MCFSCVVNTESDMQNVRCVESDVKVVVEEIVSGNGGLSSLLKSETYLVSLSVPVMI